VRIIDVNTSRKAIHLVRYSEALGLSVRFFDSSGDAHSFARDHEPATVGQKLIEVAADAIRMPIEKMLAGMNPEDRLDWLLANTTLD